MKHELQYGDSGPDWCIHCGIFAHNIRDVNEACDAKEKHRYDNRHPDAAKRAIADIFGDTTQQQNVSMLSR